MWLVPGDDLVETAAEVDVGRADAHGDVVVQPDLGAVRIEEGEAQGQVVVQCVVAGDGTPEQGHVDAARRKVLHHSTPWLVQAGVHDELVDGGLVHQVVLDDQVGGRGGGDQPETPSGDVPIADVVGGDVVGRAGEHDVAGMVVGVGRFP